MTANLTLSPTTKYFGFGDKDDVVLDGGRVIGRSFFTGRRQRARRGSGR